MAKFTGHTITSDSALGSAVIQRSLRFDRASSAHLTYTPASASSDRTKITISAWVKKCGEEQEQNIFHAGTTSNDRATLRYYHSGGLDCLSFFARVSGSFILQVDATAKSRDTTGWYHVVARCDTTNGTANIYVNGVDQTLTTSTKPSGSQSLTWFNNVEHQIGERGYDGSGTYFNGYMAEINVIQGQALDASYFGFTDSQTGIWLPKRYEGTYGDGFYLDFSDNSSTAALGIDRSPNGNDFTLNNFATTDSVTDTPTNNFCILNINDNNLSESSPHFVYSEGNLKVAWSFSGTNFDRAYGTLFIEPHDTNKYYWEATGTQNNEQMQWGVVATDTAAYRQNNRNTNPTKEANLAIAMWQPYTDNGIYAIDNSGGDYGDKLTLSNGAPANGDIFSFVYDAGAGKFYVFFKGVEPTGQDYSAGTTLFDTLDTSKTYAIHNLQGDGGVSTKSGNFVMNFGQDSSFAGAKTAQGNKDAKGIGDFYYSVPSGAVTLCSKNLPPNNPSIVRPQKHFDTLLYTGDEATSRKISGLEFQPDLVWIKPRSTTSNHCLLDSVRGVHNRILPNSSGANVNNTSTITAFNVDGFQIGNSSLLNTNSATHVAWCWKAGGNSNTFNIDGVGYATAAAAGLDEGTANPTGASVNTEAGFSIVQFEAQSSGDITLSHGLGKKPEFWMWKSVDNNIDWYNYHHSLGYNAWLNNSSSAAATTGNDAAWKAEPTSTVFTHGSGLVNQNTIIMYMWTSIPGYSKFGEWTGNGSADGPYVDLGFRPALIIYKATNDGQHWQIHDTKRLGYNQRNDSLEPSDSSTEQTNRNIDILSNGFKLRNGLSQSNGGGIEYVYMAWAEQPGTTPFDTFSNAR